MASSSTQTACGIKVSAADDRDAYAAVSVARSNMAKGPFQHVVAFFSHDYNPEHLLGALRDAFPDTLVSGCSTSGELGPLGMMQGGLVLIGFPEDGFRIQSEVIPEVRESGVERATEIARRLRTQIISGGRQLQADNVFALILIDGLSNREEALLSAVHWGMGDIELIGGSAGDGLAFDRTTLIHHNQIVKGGAVLFVIASATPFTVFKTQNFEPTPVKLVVTAADAENRIVYELNAEPAAREYAAAIGLMPDELGPFSFASYPLVVKVGGDYYCRSIRNINADGSLSFFCAIDEGLVFTVARPRDMLRTTLETLEAIDSNLGGIDMVLGFDCILRRLDAESRQVRHQLDAIYKRFGVTGFHTYGEQFNAMHLNQTLTGIAFAKPGNLIDGSQ